MEAEHLSTTLTLSRCCSSATAMVGTLQQDLYLTSSFVKATIRVSCFEVVTKLHVFIRAFTPKVTFQKRDLLSQIKAGPLFHSSRSPSSDHNGN